MLTKTEEIRTFILKNVEKHPRDISAFASQHFAISRQAVARHLSILVSEGLLKKAGITKGRTYKLKLLVRKTFRVSLSGNPEEDVIWRDRVRPLLSDIKENVSAICYHGFTEILNNAIDHSEGSKVEIGVERTAIGIMLAVEDNGVGIFNKIARELNLSNKAHALLELTKGKLTTDPKKHTGEGIFFTSRMFDTFAIISDDLLLAHIEGGEDWLLENREEPMDGTSVLMKIDPQSNRNISQVFDRFSDPEDFSFNKTHVPVRLAQYREENLISRSQAKRVLMRFERFKKVDLDFAGVEMIGQAFADEIFRVFQHEHPEVELATLNANSAVKRMILRVLNSPTQGEEIKKE